MPDRTPPNPAMNGTASRDSSGSGMVRRRLILGALVLFGAAWTIAIIYSVTAGGRSPERLDDRDATTVARACNDAQHALGALPQLGIRATPEAEAGRIVAENTYFSKMVTDLRALHPTSKAPAAALTGWLDDWQGLVDARTKYVKDLTTIGDRAQFVEPATKGIKPIADKMNDWTLEQGKRTDACNTGALQIEVLRGPRKYGAESKS